MPNPALLVASMAVGAALRPYARPAAKAAISALVRGKQRAGELAARAQEELADIWAEVESEQAQRAKADEPVQPDAQGEGAAPAEPAITSPEGSGDGEGTAAP